jgi:hypothetical protein
MWVALWADSSASMAAATAVAASSPSRNGWWRHHGTCTERVVASICLATMTGTPVSGSTSIVKAK